jgi:hypothetical protein
MSLLSLAAAVVVGTLILLSFGRWLGHVRFSLSNAFWCSLIGHVVPAIIGLALGYFLHDYLVAAFLIGIAIAWVFQTILFQIAARTQNDILVGWRAGILAFLVILADFLVASPLLELVQPVTSNEPKV